MQEPVPREAHTASGETAQSYAEPTAALRDFADGVWDVPLDWQPELDAALEAIDSNLPVKRRRSTDPPDTPPFPRPEVSAMAFTPEVLDALAARLAEKLRPAGPPARPAAVEPPPTKPGALVSIRFRWPLFSLRSARRRRVRALA